MKLEGIHHVTCLTGDAPSNADFYVRVLGLRLVKKSINQTDQTSYHIFYGDEQGSYGNNISFFEYRGRPVGRAGAGNVHKIVWRVRAEEALDFWEQRLTDESAPVSRGEGTLEFSDHEGLDHQLVIDSSGDQPIIGDSPDVPAEHALLGFDGVRAYERDVEACETFLREQMNMDQLDDGRFEARGSIRGGWYAIDPAPEEKRSFGGGCVQHVAWGCQSEDIDKWSDLVAPLCPDATGTIDRFFFRSTYFTEPGGVLFEIAEHGGPGFAAGEPEGEPIGDTLALPDWLEERRKLYEFTLTPVPTNEELRAGKAAPSKLATA